MIWRNSRNRVRRLLRIDMIAVWMMSKKKYIREISLIEIRDSMGRREKKNNVTGDKAEDENFLSSFVEWRQFLSVEVSYIKGRDL